MQQISLQQITLNEARRFLGTSVVNFAHHNDSIAIVCVIVPSCTENKNMYYY